MSDHNFLQEVKIAAYKNNMLLMVELISNLVIVLFFFGTAN